MSDKTGIEWTDATWNAIRGCTRVSEGCRNCYAEGVAARFSGPGLPYEGLARRTSSGEPRWTGEVRVVDSHLHDPIRWKRPRKIFVNSMSDLFHEKVATADIDHILTVMLLTPRHTFQVLTKRPERMQQYLSDPMLYGRVLAIANKLRAMWPALQLVGISDPSTMPAPWIWWGVSVENQAAADERIPLLLQTPAAVRFLSCEPLLGHVDVSRWLRYILQTNDGRWLHNTDAGVESVGGIWRHPLDWVIAGGESGANARPCHPAWLQSLRDQCAAASKPVAFFLKQWGEWKDSSDEEPVKSGSEDRIMLASGEVIGAGFGQHGSVAEDWKERGAAWMTRVGKKAAGATLDGREHREFPKAGAS